MTLQVLAVRHWQSATFHVHAPASCVALHEPTDGPEPVPFWHTAVAGHHPQSLERHVVQLVYTVQGSGGGAVGAGLGPDGKSHALGMMDAAGYVLSHGPVWHCREP